MRYPYLRKYEEENLVFSTMAKALGHPARVAIVRFLYEGGECDTDSLVERLPLGRSTVSEHIRILREAGFVVGREDGKRVLYGIDRRALKVFGKGVGSISSRKRGALVKGGKDSRTRGQQDPWWVEFSLSSRSGLYKAAEVISLPV